MPSRIQFNTIWKKYEPWFRKAGAKSGEISIKSATAVKTAGGKVVYAARQWRAILKDIRNKLITGVVLAIPLIVTVWVVKTAYTFINGISAPYLSSLFGKEIPGLGFLVTLLVLICLGYVATNVYGQRILDWSERLLMRVPVIATIYTITKQVIDSFKSFNDMANFKRVVYVQYPSEGCKLIGLVTGQYYDHKLNLEMVSVVIPTAPNPMTGLVIIVEASKVVESELSLEEAMKLIVSAGLVAPKRKIGPPPPPLVHEQEPQPHQ
ncbi:MAG TPA: DUF502 domain-containing protein [Chthoniobacteraceae bacterium]|nr:DUF502 domain-containing protein [Chthoniobacteraceae bacterium]